MIRDQRLCQQAAAPRLPELAASLDTDGVCLGFTTTNTHMEVGAPVCTSGWPHQETESSHQSQSPASAGGLVLGQA